MKHVVVCLILSVAVALAQEDYESCKRVKIEGNLVGLSFEGGPTPETTPQILDILDEYGISATFFVVGSAVQSNSELLSRMTSTGHEVGSSTWGKVRITGLAPAGLKAEVEKTNEAIGQATGFLPGTFRPPYNATTKALNKRLKDDFQLTVIGAAVTSPDPKTHDALAIAETVMKAVKAGDIISLRDDSLATIDALPEILKGLFAKGLEPVAVSSLLEIASQEEDIIPLPPELAERLPKP